MDYLYEMSINTLTRKIRANYIIDPTPAAALNLEPICFTEKDLNSDNYAGFITSRLDTLVVLFTREDPAKKLLAQGGQCTRHRTDECDCPTVSIPIPAVLAYHAMTLSRSLAYINSEYKEWTNNIGTSVRQFRRPTGETIRTYMGKEGSLSDLEEWYEYDSRRRRSQEEVLDRWYQQGIHLHQSNQDNQGNQ